MKFLIVAVVCICLFLICSEVNAHGRIRKVLKAPVRVTQRITQATVKPVRTLRKNVGCRVDARRSCRVNRRCN